MRNVILWLENCKSRGRKRESVAFYCEYIQEFLYCSYCGYSFENIWILKDKKLHIQYIFQFLTLLIFQLGSYLKNITLYMFT